MNIIELATKAGFERVVAHHPDGTVTATVVPIAKLQRFARLVIEDFVASVDVEPVAWIRGSGTAMLDAGGYATVYASEGMSNHSRPLFTAEQLEAVRHRALKEASK